MLGLSMGNIGLHDLLGISRFDSEVKPSTSHSMRELENLGPIERLVARFICVPESYGLAANSTPTMEFLNTLTTEDAFAV